MTNKDDFGEVWRQMIKDDAETILEKELTDEQLEYVYDRCMEKIPEIIYESLTSMEEEEELEERNKDAKSTLPRYNLYVTYHYKDTKEYELTGSFVSQEDAEKYFDSFCGWYSYQDKRITLVDKNGEKDLIDTKHEKQHEKHKNCNHGDTKETSKFTF